METVLRGFSQSGPPVRLCCGDRGHVGGDIHKICTVVPDPSQRQAIRSNRGVLHPCEPARKGRLSKAAPDQSQTVQASKADTEPLRCRHQTRREEGRSEDEVETRPGISTDRFETGSSNVGPVAPKIPPDGRYAMTHTVREKSKLLARVRGISRTGRAY